MSRMFKSIDRTWNVFVGCLFNCSYCNARKAALARFKNIPRYRDGFKPTLVEQELLQTFKPGEFIFVAYMGDIYWATRDQIYKILDRIEQFPETRFLFCTKSPSTYDWWNRALPANVIIGTTLETNRDLRLSGAPSPASRFTSLRLTQHPYKFLSIEPIMDFDLNEFSLWIRLLRPDIIEVGADNYHNNLPEPSPEKVEQLLADLRKISPVVIEKEGLKRLRQEMPE